MNKILLLLLGLSCYATLGHGQQQLSSKEMIGITPALPAQMDITPEVKKILGQKLVQMATQNGFGSFSGDFVLTANIIETDKQITGTVPAQYIITAEVSVYLLNVAEMLAIDETSFIVKGVDKMENKAMIQAVNRINAKSPNVRSFMDNCRTKIIDYYTTRIPALLAKANSLAGRDQYEEALAVLSVIPESVTEYPAIAEQMVVLYTKALDKRAAAAIQAAKSKIALRDYEGAMDDLIYVDPSSTHFSEASKIIASIKQSIDAKEQAELAEKMRLYEMEIDAQQKRHDDAVTLEKQRIDAAKQVGMARGQAADKEQTSDQSVEAKVGKWFMGKFKK